ncbi:MAG: tyrosine-type recombinase/integrase [Proteobacteria bacterium]|nr:tyrosine-type recombinase/integrase [Pseudomonadota bacterium]
MAPPRNGRREFGDTVQRGLLLRVSETGLKSWSVIYKVPGERGISRSGRPLKGSQKRITLGPYPMLGVAAARSEASKIIAQAMTGRDPRPERQDANLARHTNSVQAVSERMVELAKKQVETWPRMEQVLRDHVWPSLGNRPIADVTQADVHELLDKLVAKDKHGTAREVRKMMSRLMNYAAEKSLIPASPMAGMTRRDLTTQPKERALSDEEIRAVWVATGKMGYPFGNLARMVLLTGQRKSDWSDARWDEVDAGERWLAIPKERFKSRRGHIVPLVGAAWEAVSGLPRWNAANAFIFSTTGGEKASALGEKPMKRLRELATEALREIRGDPAAELAHFSAHDFRRTAETRLARLGFAQEVRDAVLGHAQSGLQRTYNKHDYMTEKRAALTAYAEHIMELVK